LKRIFDNNPGEDYAPSDLIHRRPSLAGCAPFYRAGGPPFSDLGPRITPQGHPLENFSLNTLVSDAKTEKRPVDRTNSPLTNQNYQNPNSLFGTVRHVRVNRFCAAAAAGQMAIFCNRCPNSD
jgi:hypothetical protein